MTPALYLIDTSGTFRISQDDKLRQAWSDQFGRQRSSFPPCLTWQGPGHGREVATEIVVV